MLQLLEIVVDFLLQILFGLNRISMDEFRNTDTFKVQRGENIVHISLVFRGCEIYTPAIRIIRTE